MKCMKTMVACGLLAAGSLFAMTPAFGETTTEYVIMRAPDGAPVTTTGAPVAVVLGKPAGTLTYGTANDECGKYFNGMSYSTSSTFSGDGQETSVQLTHNGGKASQLRVQVYFDGTRPGGGTKFREFNLYKEHANDDGICVQNSVTYYKYEITMDTP